MEKKLKQQLNDLGIYDVHIRSLNSLRLQLEGMLEAALANAFYTGYKQTQEDIIVSKEENNLCVKIIDTYSLFMEYLEKELDKQQTN
jgi:hypothetical protein